MERSVRFIKICPNNFSNESRDYRELEVCSELGMDIIVLAKGSQNGKIEKGNEYSVHRYSTRLLGVKMPKAVNRLVSVIWAAGYVRKLKPDIISGHDIICLTIGWLSNCFRKEKAKLIYDSHEFELGRNAKRNKCQKFFLKKWERFMIKKSKLMIVVSDSIADEVKKIYCLKERPLVVRNIPHRWEIDPKVCQIIRSEILSDVGDGILLVYCGAICRNRGIENAIQLLTFGDEYRLLILGIAEDKNYFDNLMKRADEFGVRSRLKYQEAVPYDQMWKYIGASDIGIILGTGDARSCFFSLPNKLFEYIQANVPVMASDLPEIRKIVDMYGVGVICQPDDEKALRKILHKITKKDVRDSLKKNALLASKELCWENEKEKLADAYRNLLLDCPS